MDSSLKKRRRYRRNSIFACSEICILRLLPKTFLEFIAFVTLVIKVVSLLDTQQCADYCSKFGRVFSSGVSVELLVSAVREKGNKM